MMAASVRWRLQRECYAPAIVVTTRAIGGGGVTVWADVSSLYKTGLYLNVTGTDKTM